MANDSLHIDTGSSANDRVAVAALRLDSSLEFFPLSVRKEGEEFFVGRMGGEFVSLPSIGGEALELMRSGISLGEAQQRLSAACGEEVEVTSFAQTMIELGFVRSIDGTILTSVEALPPSNLLWLKAHHVNWLFSKAMMFLLGTLTVGCIASLVTHPDLLPRYQDFFFSRWVGFSLLGNLIGWFVLGGVHELFHLFAARSRGAGARITLSTRLHHLALQTDVSGIWSVPRGHRYRVYLAGMAFNGAIFCISILVLAMGILPLSFVPVLKAFALINFLCLVGELHLYMRTDMYFVALDVFDCRNLFGDSLAYALYILRSVLSRGVSVEDPTKHLPPSEGRVIRIYAVAMVIGSGVALVMAALYSLPTGFMALRQAAGHTLEGLQRSDALLALDGFVALAVQLLLLVTFATAFVRTHPSWFTWLVASETKR